MSGSIRRPDFEIRTPCGGEIGDPRTKWRTIGEAWVNNHDGFISCRIDLPPQNGRIILVPFERDPGTKPAKRKGKDKTSYPTTIEPKADEPEE